MTTPQTFPQLHRESELPGINRSTFSPSLPKVKCVKSVVMFGVWVNGWLEEDEEKEEEEEEEEEEKPA